MRRRAGVDAGIGSSLWRSPHVPPGGLHGLGHTHAAQLRAEGVDIAVIRRQLGHTSIVTTVRYLDHLAPTAVIEAIRKRPW